MECRRFEIAAATSEWSPLGRHRDRVIKNRRIKWRFVERVGDLGNKFFKHGSNHQSFGKVVKRAPLPILLLHR
jgi:hypothetical protein